MNTNIPYKSNDMFDWSQKNPQRPQSDDQCRNQVLCLKPKAILTSHDAVNIFKRSLPHFTPKNTSAVVVAQEYRVSEKAIRDIWTGRTWSEATDHLAPHRAPRTPRPTGRPRGRLDTKPRKQRACVKFTGLKPAAPSSVPSQHRPSPPRQPPAEKSDIRPTQGTDQRPRGSEDTAQQHLVRDVPTRTPPRTPPPRPESPPPFPPRLPGLLLQQPPDTPAAALPPGRRASAFRLIRPRPLRPRVALTAAASAAAAAEGSALGLGRSFAPFGPRYSSAPSGIGPPLPPPAAWGPPSPSISTAPSFSAAVAAVADPGLPARTAAAPAFCPAAALLAAAAFARAGVLLGGAPAAGGSARRPAGFHVSTSDRCCSLPL